MRSLPAFVLCLPANRAVLLPPAKEVVCMRVLSADEVYNTQVLRVDADGCVHAEECTAAEIQGLVAGARPLYCSTGFDTLMAYTTEGATGNFNKHFSQARGALTVFSMENHGHKQIACSVKAPATDRLLARIQIASTLCWLNDLFVELSEEQRACQSFQALCHDYMQRDHDALSSFDC